MIKVTVIQCSTKPDIMVVAGRHETVVLFEENNLTLFNAAKPITQFIEIAMINTGESNVRHPSARSR